MDQRIPSNSIEEIIRSMPVTKIAQDYFESKLKKHIGLVKIQDVIDAVGSGAVIEKLYPNRVSDGENAAYDKLVARVIYWWFNVHTSAPVSQQLSFIKKQRDSLQAAFGSAVCITLLPQSKLLMVEFLRLGFGAAVSNAFLNAAEYWGDPADFIPADEVLNWPENSRDQMSRIVLFSKNVSYQRIVTRALSNDTIPNIRNSIRSDIKNGKLPDVSKDCEDQFRKKISAPLDSENVRKLWMEFASIPFPLKYVDVTIDGVSLLGIDLHTRKHISLVADGKPTAMTQTLLKHSVEQMAKVSEELTGECRDYFERLRYLTLQVLEELDRSNIA